MGGSSFERRSISSIACRQPSPDRRMLCNARGQDRLEPVVVGSRRKLRFRRVRCRQLGDAAGEVIELAAVPVRNGDRADVEIRIHPLQIDIGTTAPGGDALIEIAAGNERIGGRIAKLRHARELHRREIRRFINDHLRPVQFADRGERTILSLREGARDPAVFEHAPAGLEQGQQHKIDLKRMRIAHQKVFATVPTAFRLARPAVPAVATRKAGIIALQGVDEAACRCLHLDAFADRQ